MTGLIGCLLLTAATLPADTVGYWRFEGAATSQPGENNDWLDDSSGNKRALTTFGAAPVGSQQVVAAAGATSTFPLSISRSGQDNDFAAKLPTASSALRTGKDESVFTLRPRSRWRRLSTR